METVTEQLRRQHNLRTQTNPEKGQNFNIDPLSPLFILPNGQSLSYEESWTIVDRHKNWLHNDVVANTVTSATIPAIATTATAARRVRDVVIAYLADNSADLLLSMLAAMDLTETQSMKSSSAEDVKSKGPSRSDIHENSREDRVPIHMTPAMLNSRWTPVEMERALRPFDLYDDGCGDNNATKPTTDFAENDCTTNIDGGFHTTILLYGRGYEDTAKETVRLMNSKKFTSIRHEAVAWRLPEFVTLNDENKESSSSSSICSENNHMQFGDLSDDRSNAIPDTTKSSKTTSNQHSQHGNYESNSSKSDALILFTSGTSSPKGAKGVRLSHRSLLVQAIAKTHPPCRYDSRTRMVATTVPWFHVGGVSSALGVLWCGGCLVFPFRGETYNDKVDVVNKAFEPKKVWYSLIGGNANTLVVVPTMLHAIIQDFLSSDSTSSNSALLDVRLILVGGQSIGEKESRLFRDTRRIFPNARIVQTGDIDIDDGNTTDTIGSTKGFWLEGATSVGIPPPHVQIGIFDSAIITTAHEIDSTSSVQTLAPGNVGVIGTKGTHTMSGYWVRGASSPIENTSKSENEWMFTNDLGFIHPKSGKLYFCGRANDVIRTGGESVLATEVEKVLIAHEAISECAVFALPDAKFGEAVCAAIVVNGGVPRKVTSNSFESLEWTRRIREYCSRQLAGFKRPRRIFCMNELPRNSSGKVLKHELVRMYSQADSEVIQSRL
ncbi:hypothetical protein ACHAXS_013776 [Conticribra weissflogii]